MSATESRMSTAIENAEDFLDTKELDGDSVLYARMAQGAYSRETIPGWDIVSDLSNRNRVVYARDGKAVIAYRGTDPSNLGDLGSDALAGLGLKKFGARYQNALKVAKEAVKRYGAENVTTTGHSLGAIQSLFVNSELGLPAHAFNPYLSPHRRGAPMFNNLLFAWMQPDGGKTRENATVYQTLTDPLLWISTAQAPIQSISGFSRSRRVFVQPKMVDGHSVKNFIP
jgi:hypothetical protein